MCWMVPCSRARACTAPGRSSHSSRAPQAIRQRKKAIQVRLLLDIPDSSQFTVHRFEFTVAFDCELGTVNGELYLIFSRLAKNASSAVESGSSVGSGTKSMSFWRQYSFKRSVCAFSAL